MLAHLGGRDLYLKLYRDRDPKAIRSEEFKKVLQAYKRLQNQPGFGANSPYIVQGDVMVFPRTDKPDQIRAQQLLAKVILDPATQIAFNARKGSVPARTDVDAGKLDICGQLGLTALTGKNRHRVYGDMYLTPDQAGALQDAVSAFWNRNMSVERRAGADRRGLARMRALASLRKRLHSHLGKKWP